MLRVVLLLVFVGWLLTPPDTIKLPTLDPLGLSGLTDSRNWNPKPRVIRNHSYGPRIINNRSYGPQVINNPFFK